MKRIRTVGLALLALGLLSVITSGNATAAEFIPSSVSLAGGNTATALGKSPEFAGVVCTGNTFSGGVSSAMEMTKISILFTGCKRSGVSCQNGVSGEILTKELKAVLGLGMKTSMETPGTVGLLFSAVSGTFATFKCSIVTANAEGRAFCTILPLNVRAANFTLTCKSTGSTPEYGFYLLKAGEGLEEVSLVAFGSNAILMMEDGLVATPEMEIK